MPAEQFVQPEIPAPVVEEPAPAPAEETAPVEEADQTEETPVQE
jgi:hypothetical protein